MTSRTGRRCPPTVAYPPPLVVAQVLAEQCGVNHVARSAEPSSSEEYHGDELNRAVMHAVFYVGRETQPAHCAFA